jgi:F-type H+-transporting ATPase subunit gamma
METLEVLHRRLRTAGELGALVHTMKALSAVSIRLYQQALQAVQQCHRTIELGLHMVLTREPALLEALESGEADRPRQGPAPPATVVLLGADRGMCGPFNERVVTHAGKLMRRAWATPPRVLAVGHRLDRPCEAAGIAIAARIPMPVSPGGITAAAEAVIVQYDEWSGSEASAELWLVHNHLVGGTGYAPGIEQLLPLKSAWLRHVVQQPWPTRNIPMSPNPGRALLAALVRQHLQLAIHRGLAESLASEHAARLLAMQVAERNVQEHERALATEYHQRRQQTVDEELLDLISGYRALAEEAPRSTGAFPAADD